MAFCEKCGHQLPNGAKFCPNCGNPVNNNQSGKYKTREQEFAGKIIKCPVCGEELPSFTAICPTCGHEINSARVSSVIREFADKIGRADLAIANSPNIPRAGWNSWDKWKKIGWVVLNLYTLGIPLVIYLLLPVLGIGGLSALTPEEKRKAAEINNFSFPNDRESILEALLFIKSQMAALAAGKIDRNTVRWAKIWKNKAYQLYQIAEMLFKGDKIANGTYQDILASDKKIKRSLTIRVIVAIVLIAVFAILVYNRTPAKNSIDRSAQQAAATFEWPTTGIATQLPSPPSNSGEIDDNNDGLFYVDVKNISDTQYAQYILDCKNAGFTVDAEQVGSGFQAYNSAGYEIRLSYYSSMEELSIRVEAPMEMSDIDWPKSAIAQRLPVPESLYGSISWEADYGFVIYIGNTTKQDYKRYVDACYELGFNAEYNRGDDYFHAKDSDGYDVDIDYEGNNIMFVRIDEPDDN